MERIKAKLNPEALAACKKAFEGLVGTLPSYQQTERVKSGLAAHILSLAEDGETDWMRLREMAQQKLMMSHEPHFGERVFY